MGSYGAFVLEGTLVVVFETGRHTVHTAAHRCIVFRGGRISYPSRQADWLCRDLGGSDSGDGGGYAERNLAGGKLCHKLALAAAASSMAVSSAAW